MLCNLEQFVPAAMFAIWQHLEISHGKRTIARKAEPLSRKSKSHRQENCVFQRKERDTRYFFHGPFLALSLTQTLPLSFQLSIQSKGKKTSQIKYQPSRLYMIYLKLQALAQLLNTRETAKITLLLLRCFQCWHNSHFFHSQLAFLGFHSQ